MYFIPGRPYSVLPSVAKIALFIEKQYIFIKNRKIFSVFGELRQGLGDERTERIASLRIFAVTLPPRSFPLKRFLIMPKKEKIQSMFDSIAGDYDMLNHLMSLDADKGWRRKAMKKVLEGEKKAWDMQVLDLACGTGDFSIAIAEEMLSRSLKAGEKVRGRVKGVDLSEGMLKVMETKVSEKNLQDIISISQGDGEDLKFPDNSFDRVTIAFGIRNFQDREKGLREMFRVLVPGGKLVILELSLPDNALIRWAFNLYFLHILPLIGGKVSGYKAAYKYLPASVVGFPKKKEFISTMEGCGFRSVVHKAFTFGICRMYIGEKPL